MSSTDWTTERPTKPGAYIVSFFPPNENPRHDDGRLVWGYLNAALVYPTNGGLRVKFTYGPEDRPVPVDDGDLDALYWVGPLEPSE